MKPGWQTTEFWSTTIAQVLALLVLLGILTPADGQTLDEALGKIAAAVFTLVANGLVVVHYLKGRLQLKMGDKSRPTTGVLPLVLLGVLIFGLFPVHTEAANQRTAWLPWRVRVEQQLKDLHNRPPAPQQPLPIPGDPRQLLPVPGDPRQQLPLPGQPLQPLPIPGQPLQPLPIPGQPYMPPLTGPQGYTIIRALARPVE